MRYLKLFLRGTATGALVSMVWLTACGGGDAGTGPETPQRDGTMNAMINGTFWGAAYSVEATLAGGTLTIIGQDDDRTKVQLVVSGVAAAATFQLGTATANTAQVTIGSSAIWNASSTGGSGSVVVTTFTPTHITGTFSFIATPKSGSQATGNKTVSAGTFDVTIN